MVSIHTFEIKAFLNGAEYKQIKERLGIPDERKSWTEHRYNDRGIQIILYKGKAKEFIYVKYIINLKRIFDKMDYLYLLKPTDEKLCQAWDVIESIWGEIGCGVPFGRFYLSRIDLTCDVYLETEMLLHEYIRLLSKSILLSSSKRFPVDGIYHKKKISGETRSILQKNCCKFEITTCEDIQFYNKLYELQREDLSIPESIADDEDNILRIELQIHETKRITEILRLSNMHNDPIEKQFSYLIKNAEFFLLNRLERLYPHGDHHKRSYIIDLIKSDPVIKKKSKKRVIQFVEDCNKNVILGRCLELDAQKGYLSGRKKALRYLSDHNINPIVISSDVKGYEKLPDIFKLIDKGSVSF